MIFSRINLRNALTRERSFQNHLLNEAKEILQNASDQDNEIILRLRKSKTDFIRFLSPLEKANVFTVEEIRAICIRYRLRFLDSSQFKSEYPYEAITAIKLFEKKHGKISSFKIIAPSKAFDLENINKDPLLFAQLNCNSFYLIHQWGHDLAWYRRLLTWPLQNFKTLMIFLMVVCFLFAFSLPSSIMHIFTLQSEIYLRLWLTIHTFIGLLGFALWGGLSFNKTFSKLNWDSKYYNY